MALLAPRCMPSLAAPTRDAAHNPPAPLCQPACCSSTDDARFVAKNELSTRQRGLSSERRLVCVHCTGGNIPSHQRAVSTCSGPLRSGTVALKGAPLSGARPASAATGRKPLPNVSDTGRPCARKASSAVSKQTVRDGPAGHGAAARRRCAAPARAQTAATPATGGRGVAWPESAAV